VITMAGFDFTFLRTRDRSEGGGARLLSAGEKADRAAYLFDPPTCWACGRECERRGIACARCVSIGVPREPRPPFWTGTSTAAGTTETTET